MPNEKAPMIYGLIGQAMRKIGAIKKDRKNTQQGFMFRGIDAVYNALNPVMAELGLFIIPKVLEQNREERTTKNGGVMIITNLKVEYTMYAPDGSFVQGVVTGEGMDSADKSNNKALSAAMKYFCFETFMIPTEDMIDADETTPEGIVPRQNGNPAFERPAAAPVAAQVAKVQETPKPVEAAKAPEPAKPVEVSPVVKYLFTEMSELRKARGITVKENNDLFAKQFEILKKAGIVPDKKKEEYTMKEAETLINNMYSRFDVCGTELKEVVGSGDAP